MRYDQARQSWWARNYKAGHGRKIFKGQIRDLYRSKGYHRNFELEIHHRNVTQVYKIGGERYQSKTSDAEKGHHEKSNLSAVLLGRRQRQGVRPGTAKDNL